MNDNQFRDVIILDVGPVYTHVRFGDSVPGYYAKQVLKLLHTTLRARPEGYRFMPAYKSRRWNGYISLLERNKFPSGLLNTVTNVLGEHADDLWCDLDIRFPGYPVLPKPSASMLSGVQLRSYQLHAIQRLIKNHNGVAHMATNAGKTFVIAAMCKLLGGRSIVITHKKELLHQLSDVIREATAMSVGLVGDGHRDLDKEITVATVQTMHSMLGILEFEEFKRGQDGLFIDECHHTSARTMYELVMSIPAMWRFGFSGTPLKHSKLADLQLVGATGEVVVRVSNEQLIEKGHSAKPAIKLHRLNGDNELHHAMGWLEAYKELIVNNQIRNEIIITQALKAVKSDKVVLVLVDQIAHQEILASMLKDMRFYKYDAVNGNHSTAHRSEVLEGMRQRKKRLVIATGIFEEGVDVPALDMVILAAGGKSHVRLLQRIGRGLRRKEKDNVVEIIDFDDRINKHLAKHSDVRQKIYDQEGFTVEPIHLPYSP